MSFLEHQTACSAWQNRYMRCVCNHNLLGYYSYPHKFGIVGNSRQFYNSPHHYFVGFHSLDYCFEWFSLPYFCFKITCFNSLLLIDILSCMVNSVSYQSVISYFNVNSMLFKHLARLFRILFSSIHVICFSLVLSVYLEYHSCDVI